MTAQHNSHKNALFHLFCCYYRDIELKVGIPIGANREPLLAEILLYSYEAESIHYSQCSRSEIHVYVTSTQFNFILVYKYND